MAQGQLRTGNPFGGAVTMRAEYLYYDLGTRTTQTAFRVPAIPSFLNDRYRTAGNIVRFGLNFKFGDPALGPVVARY